MKGKRNTEQVSKGPVCLSEERERLWRMKNLSIATLYDEAENYSEMPKEENSKRTMKTGSKAKA